jgi:hypothetical protein
MAADYVVSVVVLIGVALGLSFAAYYAYITSLISIGNTRYTTPTIASPKHCMDVY